MKIQAFEKREDGSLVIDNPIVVNSEDIPDGLFLAEREKIYNSDGHEIEKKEPTPPEPSEAERLEALEMLMVDILVGGF